MQYDEFMDRVQERADLDSRDDAALITEVVLATLGERLYRTEAAELAAQLPKELQGHFFARQPPENTRQDTDRFSLEEFYNRVSARADVNYSQAQKLTRAVVAVLQEAVTPGEWQDALSTLPSEYGELFSEAR
ncbi:MAG TPA: DUF2267 domain-containing protein [Anaerolineae bacterium]